MTKAEVRAAIRKIGMRAECNDGEWRVTFSPIDMHDPDRREAVAYYTNDPQDAIDTAQAMRDRAEHKDAY